jgi:pilus assembly protein CpaE
MTNASRLPTKPRLLVLERTGDLAARLRAGILPAGAKVQRCPDIASAEACLTQAGWDVLVAGPSVMHSAGLRRLGSLHQRFPWVSIVLAMRERPRAQLADVIQAGATDLFAVDADDAEITAVLTRAACITRGRLSGGISSRNRGRVITVASSSGGCGKTVLATNAAEFLARTTDHPVVLVDLDLQFGEVSVALRLRPDLTIADALRAEAEGHSLDEHLDEYLIPHPDGFSVLAAPRRPVEADSITPGDIVRVLDALRARGAWVVVDTAEGLGELVVTALDTTDHLIAIATPDRPSLVNLGTFLTAVDRLGMSSERISVVLNKAEADLGLDLDEMARQLGRPFAAVVPYSREVSLSVNLGLPLIASGTRSAVTAALRRAFEGAAADPPRRRSVRRKVQVPVPVPPVAVPAVAPPIELIEDVPVPTEALAPVAPAPVAAAPDSTEPAIVLRPRRSHRPVAQPARRKHRSSRPARSGQARPSKPALAAIDCSERGPPLRLASGPGPPGRKPRAGTAHDRGCRSRPQTRPGRDCDEPFRH